MMKFKSSSSRLAILTIEVLLALIFLLTFIVNKGYLTLSARTGPPFPDVKVYSTATIDDAFADNTVLLTLNGAASKNLRTYTIEDFPELELLDVIDLTAPTVELAKKQIIAEGTKTWGELQNHIDSQMLIKLDEFRQILCLTLQEVGKENVLKAIKKLESREDVLAAEPNYRVQGLVINSKLPEEKKKYPRLIDALIILVISSVAGLIYLFEMSIDTQGNISFDRLLDLLFIILGSILVPSLFSFFNNKNKNIL